MLTEAASRVDPAARLRHLAAGALALAIFALPFSKALVEIGAAVAIPSWLLALALSRARLRARPVLFLLAAYLAVSTAAAFFSPLASETARGLLKLFKHALVFCVASDLAAERAYLRVLAAALCAAFLLATLNGLAQGVLSKDLLRGRIVQFTDVHLRVSSSFDVPTKYAMYLAFFVAACAVLALEARRARWVAAAWTAMALGGANLYYTHARGSWLAAGLVVLAACLVYRRYAVILAGSLAVLLALLMLPLTVFFHGSVSDREQSGGDRVVLWQRALDVVRANPWTGCGLNTYVRRHALFDSVDTPRVQGYYPHNGYLHLAAEQGLPALALFTAFLAAVFWKVRGAGLHARDPALAVLSRAWLAGLVSLCLVAALDNVLHAFETAFHFWMVLGIGYGLALQAAEERSS